VAVSIAKSTPLVQRGVPQAAAVPAPMSPQPVIATTAVVGGAQVQQVNAQTKHITHSSGKHLNCCAYVTIASTVVCGIIDIALTAAA
jgi:hypothetical protein